MNNKQIPQMTEEKLNLQAIEIYQSFMEGGLDNHPLQLAWDYCEERYGPINTGSPIDCLFLEAIKYSLNVKEGKPN